MPRGKVRRNYPATPELARESSSYRVVPPSYRDLLRFLPFRLFVGLSRTSSNTKLVRHYELCLTLRKSLVFATVIA